MAAGATQDEINRISRAIEAQKDEAEAKRKDERDERALDAQRQAALWAEYAGWAAWVSALVAAVALIVTGAGVILVWFTLRHTRDAAMAAQAMVIEAKATTKAAQESVEEARKATAFSQITAKAAQDALGGDRAWVTIDSFGHNTVAQLFLDEVSETNAASMRFTWRNTGRSPAINCGAEIQIKLVLPDDPIPSFDPFPRHAPQLTTIGPGMQMNTGALFCTSRDIELLRKKKLVLFIYSRITYNDLFNEGVVRTSELCGTVDHFGQYFDNAGVLTRDLRFSPLGPQNSTN